MHELTRGGASSTGDKYKVSDSSKYGRGADVAKDHAKGSKLKPQNLQGSSIAFLGDARSGDWSDSMSEESDSEMLLLDRSSSGSDSGSAVALDEASDGGVLTLDALDRSKAAPLQVKTILSATISMPPEPTAPPAPAAAAGGTLGRVLAATQVLPLGDSRVSARARARVRMRQKELVHRPSLRVTGPLSTLTAC